MANILGNRLSDFTVNVLNQGAADDAANAQVDAQLGKQAAELAPDFQGINDLLIKDKMHTVDRERITAQLSKLQNKFNEEVARDPFAIFTPEGRQIRRQTMSLLNDAQFRSRVEQYSANRDALDAANKKGILGNIYVVDGKVNSINGAIGSIADKWKVLDNTSGGRELLNISQSTGTEAIKNIEASLSKAGKNRVTSFVNFDGAGLGIDPNTTIQKIVQGSNKFAISRLVESMKDQGAISSADWDGLISKAAGELMSEAKSQGRRFTPDGLQKAANERAIQLIQDLGNGQLSSTLDRSLSNQFAPKGSGANNDIPKLGIRGAITADKTKEILIKQPDGTTGIFKGSRFPKNIIVPPNESSLVGKNKLLDYLGVNANTLQVGMPGQSSISLTKNASKTLLERGSISSDFEMYNTYTQNGVPVTLKQAKELNPVFKKKRSGSPLNKQDYDKLQAVGIDITKVVPVRVGTWEVTVPREDRWTKGEHEDLFKELENFGIESNRELGSDAAQYYQDTKRAETEDLDSGSDLYTFRAFSVLDELNSTVGRVASFEQDKKQVTEVDDNVFGLEAPVTNNYTHF